MIAGAQSRQWFILNRNHPARVSISDGAVNIHGAMPIVKECHFELNESRLFGFEADAEPAESPLGAMSRLNASVLDSPVRATCFAPESDVRAMFAETSGLAKPSRSSPSVTSMPPWRTIQRLGFMIGHPQST